jgi:hypothetical protein
VVPRPDVQDRFLAPNDSLRPSLPRSRTSRPQLTPLSYTSTQTSSILPSLSKIKRLAHGHVENSVDNSIGRLHEYVACDKPNKESSCGTSLTCSKKNHLAIIANRNPGPRLLAHAPTASNLVYNTNAPTLQTPQPRPPLPMFLPQILLTPTHHRRPQCLCPRKAHFRWES